jgi:hypothetical protein
MKFLHIHIEVSVNEEPYSYREPYGSENVSFSVPVELFDAKKISNIFPQLISVADGKLEIKKSEEEMQEKMGE